MARTDGVSYTWGRESREQYNESAAGSSNVNMGNYGIEYLLRGMNLSFRYRNLP